MAQENDELARIPRSPGVLHILRERRQPVAAADRGAKRRGAHEFGAVDTRVRVLPVLGTTPAILVLRCSWAF